MTSFGTQEDFDNFLELNGGVSPLSGTTGGPRSVRIGDIGDGIVTSQHLVDIISSISGGPGAGGGSPSAGNSGDAPQPLIFYSDDFVQPQEDINPPAGTLPVPQTMDASRDLLMNAWEAGYKFAILEVISQVLEKLLGGILLPTIFTEMIDSTPVSRLQDRLHVRNTPITDQDGNVIGVLVVTTFGDGSKSHVILRNNQSYRDNNDSTRAAREADIADLRAEEQAERASVQADGNSSGDDTDSDDSSDSQNDTSNDTDDSSDTSDDTNDSADGEEQEDVPVIWMLTTSYESQTITAARTERLLFVF